MASNVWDIQILQKIKKNATIKASVVQVKAYLDGHLEFGGLEDDQVVVLLPETILQDSQDQQRAGQDVAIGDKLTESHIDINGLQ